MRPNAQQARARLREIANLAETGRLARATPGTRNSLSTLRHEVAAIVAGHLGPDHYLVKQLSELHVSGHLEGSTLLSLSGKESPAATLAALTRAALTLMPMSDEATGSTSLPANFDPELWAHIRPTVEAGAWGQVPSQVVIYVEDWYRRRGGDPRGRQGGRRVGKDLFAHLLGDEARLALGGEPSEREGWRFLGMGLVQAIGNLHRHNIEQRDDAEQLAWSVIGLGSLLVVEMKRTHPRTSDTE